MPFFGYLFALVLLCLVGVFVCLLLGVLSPHTVCHLTNNALPHPHSQEGRYTPIAAPPTPYWALLPQSSHCVWGKLQNNELLADDGAALSAGPEPTPVMPGIWESAFCRLLWHLDTCIPLPPAFGGDKEGPRAALVIINELILVRKAVREMTLTLWVRKLKFMKNQTFLSCQIQQLGSPYKEKLHWRLLLYN